jgi:RNA polymerase sigma-70 factor (ECF subfamily)
MPPQIEPEILAAWVTRCRNGDSAAFELLFEAFRGPIYSYLARTTGDRHLAEDFLQDVFLRLVENIGRYEESGRFEAWLFRIAANRVRDWARRRTSSEWVGGMTGRGEDSDEPSVLDRAVDQPVDEGLVRRDELARLETAMSHLEREEREVLALRHYSELSFREIAEISGCPLGTVLARSHRALQKLRHEMETAEKESEKKKPPRKK